MKPETGAKILLATGILLCLLQLWLPAYYLTGDGPCHVYNAQIVHDIWAGKNTSLYQPFFTLVYRPDPNWLSTASIALLMYVVNGVVAEKIFLTLYVLLYASGFYLLLRKIDKGFSLWPVTLFLLVFPLTLAKGFYNFSFSIAFYYWVVWCWLCVLAQRTYGRLLLLLLFVCLTFFTHPLAFGFAAFTCAALLLTHTLVLDGHERKKYIAVNGGLLAVAFLPCLLLMLAFTGAQGGLQLGLTHHFYRMVELVQCKFLVNVTHKEIPVALATGILLCCLFLFALVKFSNFRKVNKYDGFLLSLLFALFIYLFFPESFLGRLIIISIRAQLLVLASLICCVAYMMPAGRWKNAAGTLLFTFFGILTFFRMQCQVKASAGAEEYLSAAPFIKPGSIVLPLCFSKNGVDERGAIIADRNFLFVHAADYMGTAKPLVMLDNYEANMGYFPVHWQEPVNPYIYLSDGADCNGGLEGEPPTAAIEKYRQKNGVAIDYLLFWCYDPSALGKPYFRQFYTEVTTDYHLVYTSPGKRSMLFERNK